MVSNERTHHSEFLLVRAQFRRASRGSQNAYTTREIEITQRPRRCAGRLVNATRAPRWSKSASPQMISLTPVSMHCGISANCYAHRPRSGVFFNISPVMFPPLLFPDLRADTADSGAQRVYPPTLAGFPAVMAITDCIVSTSPSSRGLNKCRSIHQRDGKSIVITSDVAHREASRDVLPWCVNYPVAPDASRSVSRGRASTYSAERAC